MGFYTPICHQIQILWETLLNLGDKSLLWYRRTSPVVVYWHRSAIRAAVWFAKVCWTVFSEIIREVLKAPAPPSFSPDRARVLELRRKSRGRWITEPKDPDPVLFSPNNVPSSLVESTPWSTCSPEPLPLPRLDKQLGVPQERKKGGPKSPATLQSESLVLSSLTVKEKAGTNVELGRPSLEPLHTPDLVPLTLCPPVEVSFRKSAARHIRDGGTERLPSHKSPHSKARITSDLSGVSMPSSPPRKRLHSVNSRQVAVAAPADRREVGKYGVNVGTGESEQTRVMTSVSVVPASPSFHARLSPMVTAGPTGAVLSVPKSRLSLSAPSILPLASVPQQETPAQAPALTVTCPTPSQRIQSITTIDQNLLHTNWSPSVAAPKSNESILQSGTEAVRQAGVSTVGGTVFKYSIISICTQCSIVDYFTHVRSHQTRQTSAQGKQHPSPSVMPSTVSHWPTLQPGFLVTTVRQEAPNTDGWSLLVSPI